MNRLCLIVLVIILLSSLIVTSCGPLPPSARPWDDDDTDGIPNYLDKREFNVSIVPRGNISLFGISNFEVAAYLINSSGIGDFKNALSCLGILDVPNYDVTVASVVELKMPFTSEEFIDFLASHNLIHPDGYEILFLEAWNNVTCSDGRIRGLVCFQYQQVNNISLKIRTTEYFFNGSNPIAHLAPGDTDNSLEIDSDFTIGGQWPPESSNTTKAGGKVLTISEWIENLVHYLKGEKEWTVILEKLGNLLITKTTQWFINFVAGLIGGPFAVVVIDIIKALVEGKGICVLLNALKQLIGKLGLELPWWFPDPPTTEGNVNFGLYSQNGTHLLGFDYLTNTTVFSFSHGIYSGDVYYIETMFISRTALANNPLKILAVNKGSSSSDYQITIEDPIRDRIIIGPGRLSPDESVSGVIYLDLDGNVTSKQIWMGANFSTTNPTPGQEVEIAILLKDESGGSISDASVKVEVTNGTQFFTFNVTNLGGGYYQCVIADTSNWQGSYFLSIYPEKDGYLPDNKYCTLLMQPPP